MKLNSRTLSNLSNDNALLNCSVSGPEMIRMASEYETSTSCQKNETSDRKHHEDSKAHATRFQKHVEHLTNVFM